MERKYKLLMTEKPSVARDIAAVLIGGNQKGGKGYIEGNGLLITWAVGHLVGLAEPEAYGFTSQEGMYSGEQEKAYAELPLIPEGLNFKLIVLESTKEQFEVVRQLIHRDDVDEIINCGDMGAEGHILQWLIREKAGCTKPVRRFCATSMTEEAIREAFRKLRPESDFANIVKGEFCKKKADWILGMSLSRAESLKYHANISVGRVQSPTLFFVVQRYLEVKNFVSKKYYGLALTADGEPPFTVYYTKDADGIYPASAKDSEGRVLNKSLVSDKAAQITAGRTATVLSVETQKRGMDRPQLYDITELQRDANRRYGYSAQLTLDTAQSLYETQKVLSYPRTDSRYITSDLAPYMEKYVKAIEGNPKYAAVCADVLKEGLQIDKRIVNDKEVTDHHALIVTEKIKGFDPEKMEPTKDEAAKGVTAQTMKNVLDLVICRILVALSKPYVYRQTNVAIQAQDVVFRATGKSPISMGWKGVQERLSGKEEAEEGEDEEEQTFPALSKGQVLTIKECSAQEKATTPPKLHTEATLLTAMENAGATIENGAILKGRGIGTQATRAAIIKTLFDRGYIQNKGRTKSIIPTSMGLGVIRVLPKELYSPKITANWETIIADIAAGKKDEKAFFDEFLPFIERMTSTIKGTETGVTFAKEREAFGKCPFCGSDVYAKERKEKKDTFYFCGNKECSFGLTSRPGGYFMGKLKQQLSKKNMQELISRGFTRVKVYPGKDKEPFMCRVVRTETMYNGQRRADLKPDFS